MVLDSHLKHKLREKEILLMTHIVLGYPSFDKCLRIVEEMVKAGVDLIELQIPFSEPIADGPVILRANQKALADGVTVKACIDFIDTLTKAFDIPFLIMSYFNILFKYGVAPFVSKMSKVGIQGMIIPDLPPEEGKEYIEAANKNRVSPIFIFSPTTSDIRMEYISSFAEGFVYCVARKGVTGANTDFSRGLGEYLQRCRNATNLPLALGFGVKEKEDVDFLKGKVDIAVIGSQVLRIVENEGIASVGNFLRSLV